MRGGILHDFSTYCTFNINIAFTRSFYFCHVFNLRWSSCMSFICYPSLCARVLINCHRNKAVLNGSPEIPLVFLLFQLLIAVALLHISAVIWPNKIAIPKLDTQVAKKLIPVVSVNIAGLVFNTLCLRDVEASFFQVLSNIRCMQQ